MGIRAQKDPENFAEIAKEIIKKDSTISFTWIGDGDDELKNLIDAGVEVTGWIDANYVKDKLLNSSIYLSTAKWEGMPISILEALACGLPTIAYNCPGNADIIQDRDIGYLFNSKEVIKIINLAYDKKNKSYVTKCVCLINNHFVLERYNKQINNIIKITEEKVYKIMPKNKNILIIGGSGFIGKYLRSKLLKNNNVFILDVKASNLKNNLR